MTNRLQITGRCRDNGSRYFQLWMGRKGIAYIDVRNRYYYGISLPRQRKTRARRYAVRWFWIHIQVIGTDECMSPEVAGRVLASMGIDIGPFSGAVAEMGWGGLL